MRDTRPSTSVWLMRATRTPSDSAVLMLTLPAAGRVSINTAESDGVRVARMSHTEVEGRVSRIQFEYLIGRPVGIEHATETHELGLFTIEEMLECFHRAGMHAIHDPIGLDGRGLFLARGLSGP